MQVAYYIQIVLWDYNDHFRKREVGDIDDRIEGTSLATEEQAVQYIEDFGAKRRVYQIIKTYSK